MESKLGQLPCRVREYLGRPEVTHNHLGFRHDAIDVIGPPLEHLLSLVRVLGKDVDGPNALSLMAQSLFDHVPIETLLREQRRASPSQVMDGERVHIERQAIHSLIERVRGKGPNEASPSRHHQFSIPCKHLQFPEHLRNLR